MLLVCGLEYSRSLQIDSNYPPPTRLCILFWLSPFILANVYAHMDLDIGNSFISTTISLFSLTFRLGLLPLDSRSHCMSGSCAKRERTCFSHCVLFSHSNYLSHIASYYTRTRPMQFEEAAPKSVYKCPTLIIAII